MGEWLGTESLVKPLSVIIQVDWRPLVLTNCSCLKFFQYGVYANFHIVKGYWSHCFATDLAWDTNSSSRVSSSRIGRIRGNNNYSYRNIAPPNGSISDYITLIDHVGKK